MGVVGSANKVSENLSETIVNGFVQYTVSQVFQVLTDNRTDPPSVALTAAGLPGIGQVALVAGTTSQVWCTSRKPTRQDSDSTGKKWFVACDFTNLTANFERGPTGNPITSPEEVTKTVDVQWLEYTEPIDDAKLLVWTQGGPLWANGATPIATPNYQSSQTTTPGPVTNSAGVPVVIDRTAYRKIIHVTTVVDSWDNDWDAFTNKLNSDSVTIEETDSAGTPFSQTYEPLTLRMKPPKKENEWRDSRLYYRRTFSMEHNPNTWLHGELDIGTQRFLFEGQYKPGGGTYTASDISNQGIQGDEGYEEILSKDIDGTKSTLSRPIKLNGHGMEIPVLRDTPYDNKKAFFSNWEIYETAAFSGLNL